jgi:hypothetical protein
MDPVVVEQRVFAPTPQPEPPHETSCVNLSRC